MTVLTAISVPRAREHRVVSRDVDTEFGDQPRHQQGCGAAEDSRRDVVAEAVGGLPDPGREQFDDQDVDDGRVTGEDHRHDARAHNRQPDLARHDERIARDRADRHRDRGARDHLLAADPVRQRPHERNRDADRHQAGRGDQQGGAGGEADLVALEEGRHVREQHVVAGAVHQGDEQGEQHGPAVLRGGECLLQRIVGQPARLLELLEVRGVTDGATDVPADHTHRDRHQERNAPRPAAGSSAFDRGLGRARATSRMPPACR